MATIQDLAEHSERGSSPDIGEITQNWSDSDEEDNASDLEWAETYYWHPRRVPHKYAQRNLSLAHQAAYPLLLRQFLIRQNIRAALDLPLAEDWEDAVSDPEIVDLAIRNAAADEQNLPNSIKLAYHEFGMLEDPSTETEGKWLEKDDTMVDYRNWERVAQHSADIFPKLTYEEFKDTTRRNGRRMYLQEEMAAFETAVFNIRYLAFSIQLKPDGKTLDYDYTNLRQMDLNELFIATLLICNYIQENSTREDDTPRWGVAELLFGEKWISKGFRDRYLAEVPQIGDRRISKDELDWAHGILWDEIYQVENLYSSQIYPGDEGKYVEEEIDFVGDDGIEKKKILRRVPILS